VSSIKTYTYKQAYKDVEVKQFLHRLGEPIRVAGV
jgi:hypothetical protein